MREVTFKALKKIAVKHNTNIPYITIKKSCVDELL